MEEGEKRISDLQDNMDQLECSSKDYEKLKKKHKSGTTKKCGTLWKKPNLHIIMIEEGEESQDNTIDQIFNRLIEENFPKLKNDKPI